MKFLVTTLILTVTIGIFFVFISRQIPLSKTEAENYLVNIVAIKKQLQETQGQARIILLGGSSLGLGVSARTISKETGVRTYNTGIYAGLGYENIWNLYNAYFDKKKDLIVISPEYGMITRAGRPLDVGICKMSVLHLADWQFDLFCSSRHAKRVIKKLTGWQETKWRYNSSDFDDFGDYFPELIMQYQTRPLPSNCDEMPTARKLAAYIKFFTKQKNQGYNILYIPTVTLAEVCKESLPRILEINTILTSHFGTELPADYPYLLEEKYFLDSSHHLNPQGREIKTQAFVKSIKARLAVTQQ